MNLRILPFFIFVVIALNVMSQAADDEIKTTGTLLLKKTIAVDESSCKELEMARCYLIVYQDLYESNGDILPDNTKALEKIDKKLSKLKCQLTNKIVPFGFVASKGVIIYTGGGGGGEIKGKVVSPVWYSTYYMNPESKEEFLSNLPEESRQEIFEFEKNIRNNYPDLQKSLLNQTNIYKSLDDKEYIDWYYQNNSIELREEIDQKTVEELKFDMKGRVEEYKNFQNTDVLNHN